MSVLIKFFDRLPWAPLILISLLLGLAPFQPEPHLVEKLRMLIHGQLLLPLDIFDLVMHGAPLLLLFGKFTATWFLAQSASKNASTSKGQNDHR